MKAVKSIRGSCTRHEEINLQKFHDEPMKAIITLLFRGGVGYPGKRVVCDLKEEQDAVELSSDFFSETAPDHKHKEDVRTHHISACKKMSKV